MTNEEVKAIVANPYVSPEDLVKHYLSNPQYLEEWLRAKGKALAGVSIDCTQCVVSTYIAEKLTADGFEVERLEVTGTHVEVTMEECDLDIRHPHWVQRFVKAIDMHRNPDYPYSKNRKSKIFSGNLARNILRVTLAAGVE
jgi:hypothetical protein